MAKRIVSYVMAIALFSSLSVGAAPKNGFYSKSGKTYYYKNGKKVKGTRWIKNKRYYIKKSIVQKSKFLIIKNNKYRFGKTGVLQKRKWILVKKKYYRANKNGVIIRNRMGVKIGGKKYNFDRKGVCTNKKPSKKKTNPNIVPKPDAVKPTETIDISDPDIQADINRTMTTNNAFKIDKSTYDTKESTNNFAYVMSYTPPANDVQGESRSVLIGYINKYLEHDSIYDDSSYHLQLKDGTAYYTTDGSTPTPTNGTKVTKSSGLVKIAPNCQHISTDPWSTASYDGIYDIKIHVYNSKGDLVTIEYLYSTKERCPHIN